MISTIYFDRSIFDDDCARDIGHWLTHYFRFGGAISVGPPSESWPLKRIEKLIWQLPRIAAL